MSFIEVFHRIIMHLCLINTCFGKVWRRKIEYFSLLSYDFWSQSSRGVYVKFAEKS